MVKNKRQSEPYENDGSSTESCDEKQMNNNNQGSANGGCRHYIKSVDQNRVRKILKATGLEAGTCSECVKSSLTTIIDNSGLENDLFEYDKTLWLCLKCGTQLCGRSRNQHALRHFTTPRSDQHALAVNTTNFDIWCYICDNEVNPSAHKKLVECIEFLKKESQKPSPQQLQLQNKANMEYKILATLETCRPLLGESVNNSLNSHYNNQSSGSADGSGMGFLSGDMKKSFSIESLPRVRGLTNLGNTCFFNAVLQCLAQTPYLSNVLKESSEAGEQFQLPGGVLKLTDGTEVNLEPITGTLNSWGNLTATLSETIDELKSGGGVYTPRKLLNQLTAKWPQFGGGDQHDSHELLRHLLESVRSEDLRRYQTVILHSLGFSSKVDPQTVEGEMKQKIKFYGQQAADRILKPEQAFRGFLVSTLMCQDCYHTSSRHEYFLDMSLPVSVEKPQPPIRRKSSPEPSQPVLVTSTTAATTTVSKHQLKKEREKERKAKRPQKRKKQLQQQQAEAGNSGDALDLTGDSNITNNDESDDDSSSNEQSDADEEDNCIEDVPTQQEHYNRNGLPLYDTNGNSSEALKGPEKYDNTPENPGKDNISDGQMGGDEKSSSSASNDLEARNVVVEIGISEGGANLVRQRTISNENGRTMTPTCDLQNLSLDDASVAMQKRRIQQRKRTYSHVDWSTTIAPRYQCEDGECSVQSCLNNFTALELMTGNNKVGCDACTERINGKEGKTINTKATKQFLISSPPAVLILHLKRFQVVGPRCMFRKLSKHVTFPLVLDLAPFCGSKVKNLPNIDRRQKKLLYSLYGVVEHSGSMHGGHYIAYVKVRPSFGTDDIRMKFIPQGSKAELDQTDEQRKRLEDALARDKEREMGLDDSDDSSSTNSSTSKPEDAKPTNVPGEEEGAVGGSDEPVITPPPGKWYYVSDSRVQEVNEDAVLKAQAYLLFYERIY